jgi:glycosyltransferase involved in cell wall biosynthesis/peptidoglycan/xylan/chitin deacetylase (PgdA/CDA1 family)
LAPPTRGELIGGGRPRVENVVVLPDPNRTRTEISVVVATFNRARRLVQCLEALARQSAPPDLFEVVVVDDGSTDDTADLLMAFRAPYRLRVERQANAGQAAALNRGIEAAVGRYCLFLDDDIVADEGLVAEHLRAQRERNGVIGLGALRLRLLGRPGGLARHFASWWDDHYSRLASGLLVPDFKACYSGNLSVPRDALRRVGGFDAGLTRSFDIELAYRLERAGLEIAFLPRACAEQRYSKGFREIVRDFDRMGTAAVALFRRHRELLDYPPLGDFGQGTPRVVLLRRVLLAVRAPVFPLALVDRLLARQPPRRIYLFLQFYCFWRSVRRALGDHDEWRRLTRGTTILMYHALGVDGEAPSRYILPARRFRRQLRWLRLLRYPTLSLDGYLQLRARRELPPPRAIVLTFDDGYADTAELGAEPLRRADISATVFVVSGLVGRTNEWASGTPLLGRRLLTWDELRELRKTGIELGAHGVSHRRLPELDPEEARREMVESRRTLEDKLGEAVSTFAYPYGSTAPGVEDLVREVGYGAACTIQPGPNGPAVPIHALRRVEVEGTWMLPTFALSVWCGFPARTRR